jgi:hypothetical protein
MAVLHSLDNASRETTRRLVMRLSVFSCLIVIALCSCSSISRDLKFTSDQGNAFAMVVADGISVAVQGYTFVFQRIDVDKSTFLSESFSVYFSGLGPLQGDEFKKPAELNTTRRFGGRPVTGGNYALVSRTFDRGSGPINQTCFTLGTPVFSIGDRSINILYVGTVNEENHAADRSTVESESKLVLSGYPNISAPIQPATVIGAIAFETGKGRFGGRGRCGESGAAISFRPAQ